MALPVAEMFYNSAPGASTKMSPYEICYGKPMRTHIDSFLPTSVGTPAAANLLERMKTIWERVRANL